MWVNRDSRLGMLDGLRGLALAAVVAYHVAPFTIRGGFLGVEVFFVLSGFLLSSLLLGEVARTGGIRRRAYALRRLWRMGPALVVVLLGIVLVAPRLAADDVHRLGGDVISSLAGFTNWHLIQDGNSYFAQSGRPPLVRHMWSIAVEVQFYLLCPFIVGWLARRKHHHAMGLLTLGIAASAVTMAILYRNPDPSRAYYGTDTRVGALLAGVLLAFMLERRPSSESTHRYGIAWDVHLGLLALAGLVYLVAVADDRVRWLYPLGFLATQAATMLVIAGGLRPGYLGTMLEKKPLTWLGKRSYGIYLWHWPAVALLRPGIDVSWPPFLAGALTICIALVMGAVSFRFVERPFMSPKPAHSKRLVVWRRIMRPAASVAALIPLVALSLQLPAVDPVAASLRQGERVISRQSAPPQELPPFELSASTPIPDQTVLPPPPPQVPASTTGIPTNVTAIGDSVMVGAAGALQAKLGPTGYIDAHLGRQFKEQLAVVRTLRDQGKLGDVVVAHFGNNGPVTSKQVDQLMTELSAVPRVVLVTVRVHKPWQDSVNRVYAEAATRFPAIKIADWNTRSAGHLEWFQSDGTHLKPKGAEAYASLIAASLPQSNSPAPPPPSPHPGWPLQPSLPAPALP